MIYLDYASSHPVLPQVINELQSMVQDYGNASSIHDFGIKNRQEIENVRKQIAQEINCSPEEIIFTSSASESNTLAIDGFIKAHKDGYYRVVASNIEHDSILLNPRINGVISCDCSGLLCANDFKGYRNTLFAVMLANNEVGTIQPVKEIAEVIHKHDGNYILTDASAAFGKIKIDVKDLGVDFLVASGYKIGALKGAAFLYVRSGVGISCIVPGHQELGLRGSTYNDLAIKSFGIAISNIKYQDLELKQKRDYLISRLKDMNLTINGDLDSRLYNNVNVCVSNVAMDAQQLVSLLSMNGIMCSAGSACNSGVSTPSHVLMAIGLSKDKASRSLRITFGHETTYKELDCFVNCLSGIIKLN